MNILSYESIPRKMLIFIFNILGLIGISQAFLFQEDSNQPCISEKDSLICICKDKENFVLIPNMNFDIKWITIEGCGAVDIPLGAIPQLQLQEFLFVDIDSLNIRPFALVGVQSIHTLKIQNIRDFNVQPHGFVGLFNVTNFIIKNVTAKHLAENSFAGISEVERLHIENSYLGEIRDNAFIITNISTFSIKNCIFNKLGNTAFLIHNANEVIFQDCDIKDTGNTSISLSYVDSFSITDSRFEILATNSIYTFKLKSFKFEKCIVSEMETYAFELIDASEQITFINNVIKFADEYSLFFNNENSSTHNVDIFSCCNYFTCDCSIYWIWESVEQPFYENLLKSSSCIGKESILENMVPILDSYGNCMTLENKIYLSKSSITIFDGKVIFLISIILYIIGVYM